VARTVQDRKYGRKPSFLPKRRQVSVELPPDSASALLPKIQNPRMCSTPRCYILNHHHGLLPSSSALPAVTSGRLASRTVCTSPESASSQCAPSTRSATGRPSCSNASQGRCCRFLFLVELGAALMVASAALPAPSIKPCSLSNQ
jgi:hypothetical protein